MARIEIVRNFITLTVFLSALLSFGQAWAADNQGFKDVEVLYQACLTAQEEFKDNPDEIANSACGAYIQAFIMGVGVASLYIFSNMPEDSNQFYYKQFAHNICIDTSRSMSEYISEFIVWREKHKDFNDVSFSGFLASLQENKKCREKNANIERKWEKYKGKE